MEEKRGSAVFPGRLLLFKKGKGHCFVSGGSRCRPSNCLAFWCHQTNSSQRSPIVWYRKTTMGVVQVVTDSGCHLWSGKQGGQDWSSLPECSSLLGRSFCKDLPCTSVIMPGAKDCPPVFHLCLCPGFSFLRKRNTWSLLRSRMALAHYCMVKRSLVPVRWFLGFKARPRLQHLCIQWKPLVPSVGAWAGISPSCPIVAIPAAEDCCKTAALSCFGLKAQKAELVICHRWEMAALTSLNPDRVTADKTDCLVCRTYYAAACAACAGSALTIL